MWVLKGSKIQCERDHFYYEHWGAAQRLAYTEAWCVVFVWGCSRAQFLWSAGWGPLPRLLCAYGALTLGRSMNMDAEQLSLGQLSL